MEKDTLINYIYQLGFDWTRIPSSNSKRYMFKLHHFIFIEIEKSIDYYTSWYGNHPTTYHITFGNDDGVFKVPLVSIKDSNQLIEYTDNIFMIYRSKKIAENVIKIYDSNKKSIVRDNRINDILFV